MAHVTRKISSALEGALAGGGDPATSPLYVFTPFLKLIVIGAVVGVADVTFGATVWLVVFTVFVVSAMYRHVVRWVTDGSGGSGLSEEEFGGWAVKVNAAITFIEYTLTFLVSMAAMVTFIADCFSVLNQSAFGIQYRAIVAIALSVLTGWLVNRGPKMAARTFGPATAGVLLLLWAMVLSTLWRHLTGDPRLAGVGILPGFHLAAFSLDNTAAGAPSFLSYTLGGYARILAVMTGIEVFANLVAAYQGTAAEKARKAFGSLVIIMGTTGATMLIVGPAILAMSDPRQAEMSVFTQTMDQLLPIWLSRFGTFVAVAVLLSASAASAQGLQNLAGGLTKRYYLPAMIGRPNVYGVADKPVWIEVGICCACFLGIGTSEETYLAIYAAGVFILLSMTGWAASKRLIRQLRLELDFSTSVTLLGAMTAAALTSVATVIIFGERFFEGAWTFLLFIPVIYAVFAYFRNQLGAPSAAVERLGEIEEAALGGFGPGQFEPLPPVLTDIAVDPATVAWPVVPPLGEGWRGEVARFDHLLVPLDGTRAGERALPLVRALARPPDSRLELLSVIPGGSDGHGGSPPAAREAQDQAVREQYLRELADQLASAAIAASSLVVGGPVAATISAVADRSGVDGVVISTHIGAGSSDAWLGRVAGSIVQNIRKPVILVRTDSPQPEGVPALDRVLVALDGSEFAERVLPYARWLAARYGTELVLLAVPEVPSAEQYGPLADLVRELRTAAEDKAQSYLEDAVLTLRDEGLSARGIVAGSAPARTILAVAARENAAMTMIATHGRGGLARLLMGSIAERVLRHTSCPVFLLPVSEHRPTGVGSGSELELEADR